MLNEAQLKDLLDKALAGKASEAELRSLADALKRMRTLWSPTRSQQCSGRKPHSMYYPASNG